MSIPPNSGIECPVCGDCNMDEYPPDMLECPQCGVQYRFEHIGDTDTSRCPEGAFW